MNGSRKRINVQQAMKEGDMIKRDAEHLRSMSLKELAEENERRLGENLMKIQDILNANRVTGESFYFISSTLSAAHRSAEILRKKAIEL